MAERINPTNKRIKGYHNGTPYISCNNCKQSVKWGFLNEDVMALPERITKEDWLSELPLFCKSCKEKNKK